MICLKRMVVPSIACILAVCFIAGIFLIDSNDSEAASVGDYTDSETGIVYTCYDDGTAEIKRAANVSGEVIIPSKVTYKENDYTVKKIGSNYGRGSFANNAALTSVVLPSTIEIVDSDAFSSCSSLTCVDFSNCTKLSFGSSVFTNCTSLTTVKLGSATITSFGSSVFSGCTKLASAVMSNNVIYALPYVESYVVPDGVTTIYTYAAYRNNVLKELTVPSSVTTIGQYAIGYCTSLESVTFTGSGSINLENNAFNSDTKLTTFELGEVNINTIGRMVFYNCALTTDIVVGDVVHFIPRAESYVIPDNVTEIADYAANGNTVLGEITFSSNLVKIGSSAFSGCTSLVSIDLPSTIRPSDTMHSMDVLTWNPSISTVQALRALEAVLSPDVPSSVK